MILNLLLSCHKEEIAYNPCARHFQTEDLKPSTASLNWIPYINNQELIFSNQKGDKLKLIRTINNTIAESLKAYFLNTCPNDAFQKSVVEYTSFEYQNKFIVVEGQTSLVSIDLNVDVILDAINSNLDELKLSDIINIDFKLKNNATDSTITRVLQFPILNRGFLDALHDGYLFSSSLSLNMNSFSEVYYNYENNEQLRAYYSLQGLLAFEIQGDLFLRIQ